MFAQWTSEILWQFFANIFISTNSTSPYCLSVFCFTDSFWLWFDVFLIVFIGGGRNVIYDICICDISEEQSVGSHEELIQKHGIYYRLVKAQLEMQG